MDLFTNITLIIILTAIDREDASRALSTPACTEFQLGKGTAMLVGRSCRGVTFLKTTSSSAGLGLEALAL